MRHRLASELNPEDENSRLTDLVMNLEEKVSSLETEITVLNSELEDCRQVVQEMASAFGGSGIADMRREMEQMSIQIGLLQRAVSNVPAVAPDAGARLRILNRRPIVANQVRLDTWHFCGKRFESSSSRRMLSTMPGGIAEAGHTGSVRDYVKTFSALMLDIRDMSEKDKLFTFMEGLKPWARLELQRQRISTRRTGRIGRPRLAPRRISRAGRDRSGVTPTEVGGDRKPHAQSSSHGSFSRNKPQENKQGAPQKSSGCFLCDGPHRYRDCPKKQLLNALATFTDKASPAKPAEPRPTASGENDSEDEDNLGAISQWCNTLSHQVAAKKTMPPRAERLPRL
ncbi:UNVERIFIED_CONTAM: hypothetical protein Sangu_1229900 [Sesamum angustifolium]|uniref:Retrotransposon gag domain-containing protein n=1 Tax=Sesamum angustifolium TaxID=2727405 RepID=A0AAW2NI28_9LAMI